MPGEAQRYRFGPREQRGVFGALRPGQVVLLAVGLLSALVLLQLRSMIALPLVFFVGSVVLATAFWPIAGRTPEQWAPILARTGLARVRGRRGYRASAPVLGLVDALGHDAPMPDAPLDAPAEIGNVEMLAAPFHGEDVGVLKDRAANTYTAVVAVRVSSFGLLSQEDQEQRLRAWGEVLASMAREDNPIRRLQWVERTVPADGDEIASYLQEERDTTIPLSAGQVVSYIELIESGGTAAQDHELFLALQLDARRAWKQIKKLGGGDDGACALLLREVETFAGRLGGASIEVQGVLRPRTYARALRDAFDPYGRSARNRAAAVSGESGIDPQRAWPMAAEATWATYRSDSALHATYWLSGWPRLDVGASFLAPLLMQTNGIVRTISVVMEPIAPSRAIRRAEAARTADIADEQTRARHGFLTTARKRSQQEATARREQELADGYAEFRYSGFVVVSARDADTLERDCAQVEHAGHQARLELERLFGEQATAFTFGLPIGRGLL
jgi:Putative type VII ESX secretion system translocon, EccE